MTPPFTAAELEATRKPLLQATQLPPRAYVDEAVADWEAEHLFLGGWVCVGHAQPLASPRALYTPHTPARPFLPARHAGRELAVHGRRRGPPPRRFQRVPPPRRPPRHRARGH